MMEGRWKLLIGRNQIIGYETPSGNRMLSNPAMDMHTVPVVPCDDAAIERAASALHVARGLPAVTYGMDNYCECREQVLVALRAAGEVA